MTAQAHQLYARELGAGRWRVELAFADAGEDRETRRRRTAHGVSLRSVSGAVAVRIETITVAPPSARDRFSLVLAVDEPAATGVPARFELSGDGWSAHVELTPSEEPAAPRRPPVSQLPAAIDYRARDFDALRTMLLGVIDERFGTGLADHPVAQTSALVEQIAYLGDALSYQQDAVATEAYLASARRRVSATRHAALLDYTVFEGRSARVWVRFDVSAPVRLAAGTQVLARASGPAPRLSGDVLAEALAGGATVFETLEPVELAPPHEPYQLSRQQHPHAWLPAGATSARLAGDCPGLRTHALVLIAPAPPHGGGEGHVVRLQELRRAHGTTRVSWAHPDALPDTPALTRTPLCLCAGNIVLAEQGRTHGWAALPPPVAGRRYWPRLPADRPAFGPVGPVSAGRSSAAGLLAVEGRPVRAAVRLREGHPPDEESWAQRPSLLESGPLDRHYVVEIDDGGAAHVRFGDGTNGVRPAPGMRFSVWMRSGGGSAGNVGAGAIAHVATSDARVRGVHNPAPACGGAESETIESVRINAPLAFRTTDRAVTPAEYDAAALAVDGVADATAGIVASGSGPLARVRVHTGDWSIPADPVVERVRRTLERLRPVGVALDVGAAIALPVTIALQITVQSGWALAAMSSSIDDVLRDALLGPRRFGFGTVLHRSDLIMSLADVAGVVDVTLTRFDWTSPPSPRRNEVLVPPFGHIIRIDDDPVSPALGSVSFRLRTAA